MPSILLIDDEIPFLRALTITLRARGYEVEPVSTGEEGLKIATRHSPDLVILDLGLPGMDGTEVVKILRDTTQIPVIVLSARGGENDKVLALDCGADDYVTKPFQMGELLARVRAAIRRTAVSQEAAVVSTAHFSVDLARKHVNISGNDVRLTPTQWRLVEILVKNQDHIVSQHQLLKTVWGSEYSHETNYLRVFMAQIRRILEPDPSQPRYFLTEPGMGYRFTAGSDARQPQLD
ncbi:MAG: response regulator transcription factor [Actinobacteria bacterium]|nr:response regulator transcription factor [Actinomycetota bacterium]MCL6105274.1 response regulator transcription factor [Actinomycetota bacterium]